ncbi:MAG: phosphate ABC transporter permease PstA [Eubacteriales bacterium]|nr:phosphate ABC transporter permease PstA [Eubacteriales bacterium]
MRQPVNSNSITKGSAPPHVKSVLFKILTYLCTFLTVLSLASIVAYIFANGIPNFFFRDENNALRFKSSLFAIKYTTDNVSMFHAIINTLYMTFLSLLISVPLGVFGGIYLAEYAPANSKLVKVVRITSETLAGLPSIIYGLFGMLFFVNALGWSFSLLAGAFTLAIMVLPVILRQTEESLLSVPRSYREGSLALGAGKLRTTMRIVLPVAMPGILAGVLLSIGRIVGETAALIYTSGIVAKTCLSPMESGRTLAVHLYQLQQEGLHLGEAFAVAVVLLIVVIIMNSISSKVAQKFSAKD